MRSIMDVSVSADPPLGVATVAAELRRLLATGGLDLPLPGAGCTSERWAALAGWGRRDLAFARLAEGHTDAVAVLAEAGRSPEQGALYGVWAARSGGAFAQLHDSGDGRFLRGTVRFCSGASFLDRALVVADLPAAGPPVLVDVAVADHRVTRRPESWQTAAMAAADTQDVDFDDLPVDGDGIVGAAGWYTGRPGFAIGGAGVAAVWWGGAAGVLARVVGHLPADPDAHQLAHLGELHALLDATDALLGRTAAAVDAAPGADHALAAAVVRSAVERAVREVLDRAPRMVGAAPLSRDPALARGLADLGIYVRQHHGERDHAALGSRLLDGPLSDRRRP